jgi:preprotein translocase SecF subunit
MFTFVQKRRWFFLFSAILLSAGVIAMIVSAAATGAPLHLSVDFTGGSLLELQFQRAMSPSEVRAVFDEAGLADTTVQTARSEDDVIIRTKPMQVGTKDALEAKLRERFGDFTELRFDSVGPTVGRETTRAAGLAILAASLAILFFIAIAFRNVPNAFRYGVCAIAKMLHDVLFLIGFASLMGLLAGWEVDSLFLTAVLTVVGFSVQDVIVVFDRIRENITRRRGEPFETIVNRSLLETLHRSLATQLNGMFVMVAIIFFGGITIRQFILAMLVGMLCGTYSSLCIGVPLLVVWERGELGRFFRGLFGRRATA